MCAFKSLLPYYWKPIYSFAIVQWETGIHEILELIFCFTGSKLFPLYIIIAEVIKVKSSKFDLKANAKLTKLKSDLIFTKL